MNDCGKSMTVEITSGNHLYKVEIPQKAEIEILKPRGMKVLKRFLSELDEAFQCPGGGLGLKMLAQQIAPKRVALVVPDDVLPEYLEIILPVFLDQIVSSSPDLVPARITIVIRKGKRYLAGDEKFKEILRREVVRGFRVISHYPALSRLVDFGMTKRGTPVLINADLAEADLKLIIGQLYPHQLVGFTGAASAIASGCVGADTLAAMNRIMLEDVSKLGLLTHHPLREDLVEIFSMAGIHMALSLLLNAEKQPVRILAGDPGDVLRKGARICTECFGVSVTSRFDIVVAACGDASEANFSHHLRKTLLTVSQVVKEGGKVLIFAGSNQEVGNDIYFNYVCQSMCPETLVNAFRESGRLLATEEPHLLEQVLIDKEMDLAVGFDQEIAKKCQFRAADATAVVGEWVEQFQGTPRIAVIPEGTEMCYFNG